MFDLQQYLRDKREEINTALDRVLPPETMDPEVLHRAIRYCVLSGGKRIRPVVCIAAAEATGTKGAPPTEAIPEAVLMPAVALELLHTYTLVHDDLPCMDNDDARRGRPSCHVAFGEANAVLVGDALQALAFEIAAREAPPPPYSGARQVTELAEAAGSVGVVGGQVQDIASAGQDLNREAVESIHSRKTAALFRAAARMGGIAAGATPTGLDALTAYGHKLGLAFQITDDLLDETAGEAKETTCLSVLEPEEARRMAETLIREAATEAVAVAGLGNAAPLVGIAEAVANRTS